MKFGLSLPNQGPVATPENMVRLARLGQELSFDSLWVSDHLFIPYQLESRMPYNAAAGRLWVKPTDNVFEPLMTLAFLGGIVQTPKLGIGVLVIPYRDPVVTAKMLVTLDVLTGGRAILGAGVGWMREEFETFGASYQDRGAVTDEYIRVFKELCTADEPHFEGKHYRVSNVGFYPKPVQKPHPPVWIGGQSTRAIRRVARLGDGWLPSHISPETLAENLGTLRRFCEEAGRDPDTIEICPKENIFSFGDPRSDRDAGTVSPTVKTQQMVDTIHRYEEAGASHIVLDLIRGITVDEMVHGAERFADQVKSKL